jgi:hypothetical protein
MSEEVSLDGVSVTIGIPIRGGFPPETAMSLCATVQRCAQMGIRCEISVERSSIVTMGRDFVLDNFLRGGMDRLFWIDSDMVWSPDDFMRLLAISTRVDVVGASYPAKVEGPTKHYVLPADERKVGPFGIQEAKGFGLGFTVVSREVCEKIAAKAPRFKDGISGREMASVFRFDIVNGLLRTEDMAFFSDIRDLGYTVWIDPSIDLGHIGEKQWRGLNGIFNN